MKNLRITVLPWQAHIPSCIYQKQHPPFTLFVVRVSICSPAGNGLSVSGTGCGSTYYCIKTQTYQAREPTAVEIAITEQFDEGSKLLVRLAETTEVSAFRPELQGAIFCGHLVADLDSIAGAIGASILYGGTPARASEVFARTFLNAPSIYSTS
jgi:hypothetical protein